MVSDAVGYLRAAVRGYRDHRFAATAPIPMLPDSLAERLLSTPVVVPARSWFEPGNQEVEGLIHLVSIATTLGARTIFEIGTYNGLTALTFAMNLSAATVHTLDLPPGEAPQLRLFSTDSHHLERLAPRVFEGRPEAARIVQHLGDSASFDFTPLHGSVDVVYIDGAHSEEYVANDTRVAFELVSPRGAIIWDDYCRQVPDVRRFLNGLEIVNLYRLPRSRLVAWIGADAVAALAS